MKNRYFIFLICLVPTLVFAQSWQIRTDFPISPEGLFLPREDLPDNALAGISLSVNYIHPLNESIDIYGGLAFHGNSIANHTLIKLGGSYDLYHREKSFLSAQAEVGNGIALFSQSPLYSFNASILFYWNYITKKKNHWSIGPGIQYFTTPGYSAYSKRYQFFTIPISLMYSF